MPKPKPLMDLAENKRKKAGKTAQLSYLVVFASLAFDGLASVTNQSLYLFISGFVMIVAWWMVLSSFEKVDKILKAKGAN